MKKSKICWNLISLLFMNFHFPQKDSFVRKYINFIRNLLIIKLLNGIFPIIHLVFHLCVDILNSMSLATAANTNKHTAWLWGSILPSISSRSAADAQRAPLSVQRKPTCHT